MKITKFPQAMKKFLHTIWGSGVPCVAIPIAVALVFVAFLLVISPSNNPTPLQPRHIAGDTVNIAVSGYTHQRRIEITRMDTSQTMAFTATSRTVLRRRSANTAPSAPRERIVHSGDIINIRSVNGLLVIHELETGRLHFI